MIKIEYDTSIETDFHKKLFDTYCALRRKAPAMSIEILLDTMEHENPGSINFAKMFKWEERFRQIRSVKEDKDKDFSKEDWKKFVKDTIASLKNTLSGVDKVQIVEAKDLKSIIDSIDKMARLDLVLSGDPSEHIQIDVSKDLRDLSEDELKQLAEKVVSIKRGDKDIPETEDI